MLGNTEGMLHLCNSRGKIVKLSKIYVVCSGLAFFSWLFGWNETRAHVAYYSEVRADVQNLDFFMGLGLQNSRRESFTVSSCYGVEEYIFYS